MQHWGGRARGKKRASELMTCARSFEFHGTVAALGWSQQWANTTAWLAMFAQSTRPVYPAFRAHHCHLTSNFSAAYIEILTSVKWVSNEACYIFLHSVCRNEFEPDEMLNKFCAEKLWGERKVPTFVLFFWTKMWDDKDGVVQPA